MKNLTDISEEQRAGRQEGRLVNSGKLKVESGKLNIYKSDKSDRSDKSNECISKSSQINIIPKQHNVKDLSDLSDLSYLSDFKKKVAFTLAEVLVTLGIIGVVAAMVLPTVFNNIQERVRKEQVRTVKYKLTQATDKMKSMGLLQESYPTTMDFVNELKKHYKIAKVCDSSHISDCWPSDKITTIDGDINVSSLQKGSNLKSLGVGTKNTDTVGIITADGTPIIMTYSPKCSPLDPAKTYSWSTVDNKPETNATTNCISAIFDINGKNKPNRIGKDVRTFNSILGYKTYTATSVNKSVCEELKKKNLVNGCNYDSDYYAGAVKKCNDIGLHLPSFQTLAVIAGATYGRTDIGPYTLIMSDQWATTGTRCCAERNTNGTCKTTRACTSCIDYYENYSDWTSTRNADRVSKSEIICLPSDIPYDTNGSAIGSISGYFWSSSELSASLALRRTIRGNGSYWYEDYRNSSSAPFCVGD